jgi:hypothetical protein
MILGLGKKATALENNSSKRAQRESMDFANDFFPINRELQFIVIVA